MRVPPDQDAPRPAGRVNGSGPAATAADVERDTARTRRTGYAYGCLVVLLFAGFILVSRAGLTSVLTLPDVAALRFGVSVVLLLPFLLRHGLGDLRLTQVIGMTALGGIGFALLAYAGFALAPASHGGVLIHGTLALTTALIARMLRLPVTWPGRVLGLLVVAAGVAVTAWDGWAGRSAWTLVGDLCLIAAWPCSALISCGANDFEDRITRRTRERTKRRPRPNLPGRPRPTS